MNNSRASKSRRSFLLLILVLVLLGFVLGQYIQIDIQLDNEDAVEAGLVSNTIVEKLDPEDMIGVVPDNLEAKRKELNQLVFGCEDLPDLMPEAITNVGDPAYKDLTNLSDIQQFEIMQYNGINSVGYIFHPDQSNNRLMLYHQGHRGDFIKGIETISWMVEKGFTVYAFCMPLLGKNNQPGVKFSKIGEVQMTQHERLKYLDYPIQYFINPIVAMLNYAEQFNFEETHMIGISGGGWTTTLAAAIDTRIEKSFPVAGTYPMFIRMEKPKKNYGDFEQTYPALYSKINYLDMYIMGATGEGRKQLQVLNEFDPCCFDEQEYHRYHKLVAGKVDAFKAGNFDVFLDSSHEEHKISEVALEVIGEELGES